MTTAELSLLDIAAVASALGFQVERLGAGLARLFKDQDVMPFPINIDAQTVKFESGEEGGPLELVMTALSCDKKEAFAWFKKNYSKKREEKMEIIETDIFNVKLSQDFRNSTAYFTVSMYVKKGGSIVQQPHVITSAKELFPCTEEELQKRSIFFDKIPFPRVRWNMKYLLPYARKNEQAATLADCYQSIMREMEQYLDFGDRDMNSLIALWIIGTYCYRLFPSVPYLHLNGSAGCGKTKTLQFIAELAFNGESFSSNTSPAAILRTIDANSSTCCIDEVEGISQGKDDETRSVLSLLNSGYKLGGGDLKCELNAKKQYTPVWFDGYCPKVLAGIKTLDHTLATRCIPILMLRTHNKDILNRELPVQCEDFEVLRSMLYPAILESFIEIRNRATTVQSITLTGREWELWKPIITLASFMDATGELCNRMRALAQRIQNNRKETDTATPLFLSALDALLVQESTGEKRCSTEELYSFLSGHDESFEWLSDITRKSTRGKWLGNELRRSGVVQGKSELRSIAGEKCKGYVLRKTIIQSFLSAYDGYTVTPSQDASLPSAEPR